MIRPLLLSACVLLGLSGLLGCEVFGASSRVVDARLIDVAGGTGGPGSTAVVAYQVPGTEREARFVLPLESAAAGPFVYHGAKRSPTEILLDVPAEQRARILAAR